MNNFEMFMDLYPVGTELVDSTKDYYILLNKIRDEISVILNKSFIVKASCGNGRLAEVPWICVFNPNITKSATNGLFIVILFKKDMSGFFLTLGLGMQSFLDKYGKDAYENLNIAANYFREQIISNTFDLGKINLGVSRGTRGFWYENATIKAKYYQKNSINIIEFKNDLFELVDIYNDIYDNMNGLTFVEAINNIISNTRDYLLEYKDANFQMQQELLEITDLESSEIIELSEIPIPTVKHNKYIYMTKESIKKVDGIKKAKKDAEIGYFGEHLVLEYEKQKMKNSGREDLASKVSWVSRIDDSLGYDIKSFDFDNDGKEYEIYIEVKTTDYGEKNNFYLSRNEFDTMRENSKNYLIYRVCKNNNQPVFYKINFESLVNKFNLIEYNYIVEFK